MPLTAYRVKGRRAQKQQVAPDEATHLTAHDRGATMDIDEPISVDPVAVVPINKTQKPKEEKCVQITLLAIWELMRFDQEEL